MANKNGTLLLIIAVVLVLAVRGCDTTTAPESTYQEFVTPPPSGTGTACHPAGNNCPGDLVCGFQDKCETAETCLAAGGDPVDGVCNVRY